MSSVTSGAVSPYERGITSQADIDALDLAGIPPDLPRTTYSMIGRTADRYPDAPALSFFLTTPEHKKPERWTYRELHRDITRTANFFSRLGIGRADVVALVLPNLPETHFATWGGEAAGIVCPINPLLEASAIAELLNSVGAKVLVTLAPFPHTDVYDKVHTILDRVPTLKHLVLVNLVDRVRGIKHFPAMLLQKKAARRFSPVPSRIKVHDFGRGMKAEPGDRLTSGRVISPDDFSSFFCTGGTTGTPKIAMRRHANETANAFMGGCVFPQALVPGKTIFCGLPLFHVNGILVTGLLPFHRGCHVMLGTPQGYRGEGLVKNFWEIVATHRISLFSGVPTLFAGLLPLPVAGHDVSCLEYAICGAAPMPVELFRNFEAKTGLHILEGYGLTEGTCVSAVNPPLGEKRVGSIGLKLPFQKMKTVILDETGAYVRDCANDEIGSVAIFGPNVFSGYRDEAHNKGVWIDMPDGRWLNTGDLGRRDADGYFWLTGRRKEIIIRGGHNIDPALIEEPLCGHPAVALAAAVGHPDPKVGEMPVAYVQLKAGMSASEADLLAFAQKAIAERAAIPKAVRVVDALPLTAVGKIFKPSLKHREAEIAARAALEEEGLVPVHITVAEDKRRGMFVRATMMNKADADRAAHVLGRFAFASAALAADSHDGVPNVPLPA